MRFIYAPLIGELSVGEPTLRPLKAIHLPETEWNMLIKRASLQIIYEDFIAYNSKVHYRFSRYWEEEVKDKVDFMYISQNFKVKKRNYTEFHEI